jgi:hypothetical protein
MITTSTDVFTLDFAVLVDISTPNPTVKFTNQSTGPNLPGCKWLFNVITPNNQPIHVSDWNTPDGSGAWTEFTFPESLPQPGGNIAWSGSPYRFRITVRDASDKEFTYEKTADICRPSGNQAGSNAGKGIIPVQVKCTDAKLYVEDKTNYSYKKQILPSLIVQKRLTLVYPPNEQGTFPTPFVINDFTNGLIPISFSSPGYQAILESIVHYDLGSFIFLKVKYKVKETFAVQCNIDLCQLMCEYTALTQEAQKGCDKEMTDKLTLINAKMNQALVGKMQPLCKIDVGKLVEEIKELGGFDCNCDCGNGIVALINPAGGSGVADCNAVIACIKGLFDTLDPKCLATNIQWTGLGLAGQLQLLIDKIASVACPVCTAPTGLAFDPGQKLLKWLSTNNSTVWRVEIRKASDPTFTLHVATTPIHVGNGYWTVDLSGYGFQVNTEYYFQVSAQCANGTYSTPATSTGYIAVVCNNINDITGSIS